jgi:hypothetical protein
VAVPATVAGERSLHGATGSLKGLGRRTKAINREPGNLPCAVVLLAAVGVPEAAVIPWWRLIVMFAP